MRFFARFRPAVHIPLILGGIVLAAALAFVFGLFVMLLWNWLMPGIFGLAQISYWQAWGLVILSHILFKSGFHHKHAHHDDKHEEWKDRFKSRIKEWKREKQGEDSAEQTAPPDPVT
jgi:high-affinity Fe2+/Pb2+ permease